jgi:hypothetical protein
MGVSFPQGKKLAQKSKLLYIYTVNNIIPANV